MGDILCWGGAGCGAWNWKKRIDASGRITGCSEQGFGFLMARRYRLANA